MSGDWAHLLMRLLSTCSYSEPHVEPLETNTVSGSASYIRSVLMLFLTLLLQVDALNWVLESSRISATTVPRSLCASSRQASRTFLLEIRGRLSVHPPYATKESIGIQRIQCADLRPRAFNNTVECSSCLVGRTIALVANRHAG